MNSSMTTADRPTHRKIVALAMMMAAVTTTIAMIGRGAGELDLSHRSPGVMRSIASSPFKPIAMAEQK
jgi:hypothetical protein